MILLPAIDILEGKAVRLTRGDFDQRTVYDADPLDAARRWVDGGRAGAARRRPRRRPQRRRRRISSTSSGSSAGVEVPVQVGGGLRNGEAVRDGARRGRDARRARHRRVSRRRLPRRGARRARRPRRSSRSTRATAGWRPSGWTEQTEIPVESVIEALGRRGVSRFVYSSIERDGMLSGPDLGRGDPGRSGRARNVRRTPAGSRRSRTCARWRGCGRST